MRSPARMPTQDWITVTVRWFFIVCLSLWMIRQGNRDPFLLALIGAAMIGNVAVTILTASGSISSGMRVIILVLDFLYAQLTFFMGGAQAGMVWTGLLPLITAALYFGWVGAVIVALLNSLAQAVLFAPGAASVDTVIFLIGVLAGNLLIGLTAAYLNRKFMAGAATEGGGRSVKMDPRQERRRHTIYDLISALSATLNYQKVVETALDLAAAALKELNAPNVEKLVSAVLLFDEEPRSPALDVVTSRNMVPSDRDIRLPGMSGILAGAIDEGQAELTRSVNIDPELSRMLSFQACRAAYCLPLRTGLDAYGLLLFAHPDSDFFTVERREILDIIAKQGVIALQNARLYQNLEQEKNRMVEIQEEGRKKLARDLHDGPTQSISAIAMRVNFARRLMDRDSKAAAEELYKIEELARQTTKEIRHMLFTLRPLVLESQGLVAALNSMSEKMGETFGKNVIIQADPRAIEAIESNKQAVVFYIAEEAVNNARKHAKAEHIWVRLKALRDGLSLLEVEDDGVGFDTDEIDSAYENRGSLGMINLRERTELVNGVLRIDSGKGRGTRVQVVIPLTEEAADRIHRVA